MHFSRLFCFFFMVFVCILHWKSSKSKRMNTTQKATIMKKYFGNKQPRAMLIARNTSAMNINITYFMTCEINFLIVYVCILHKYVDLFQIFHFGLSIFFFVCVLCCVHCFYCADFCSPKNLLYFIHHDGTLLFISFYSLTQYIFVDIKTIFFFCNVIHSFFFSVPVSRLLFSENQMCEYEHEA